MKRNRSAAFTPLHCSSQAARTNSAKPSHRRTLKRPKGCAPARVAFHEWPASLPTALERDTLLMPDAIAESVVQEVERFLKADLPIAFSERLAAKAHRLYPRHRHFRKMLNRPGNRGRDNLYVYMRHWTAGWLKRERYALFKRLPREYSSGRRLPVTAPGVPKDYPDPAKLLTEDCIISPGTPTAQSDADAAHFYSATEEPPPNRTN